MSRRVGSNWERAAFGFCLSLALVLIAWHATTAGTAPWLGWVLAAPLLIGLPGLLRGRRYTYQWLSLALGVYAGYAVMESVANPVGRPWASAAALLACLSFVAVIGRFRYPRRAAGPAVEERTDEGDG
jgi:uncharacterized membrane protein